MPSDVPRLRYLLPKFKGNYNAFMKTLESSCAFASSDVAKFRLKVVEFGKKYGWKAVQDAFHVKRSTYFLWKQKMKISLGKLSSLVPSSTRPHHVRMMHTNPKILDFIRGVRMQYGRVGKEKLKILVDAYCREAMIPSLHASTIGKIIKKHQYFFEGKRRYHQKRSGVLRARKAPRETQPGYIEMDSVIIHTPGAKHTFITAIDVVTKYAACLHAQTATSSRAQTLLQRVKETYRYPIRVVQTDNGSEFLGEFDLYCQHHQIPHMFTYPRSPKINGGIERFNRTIQEEFIERTDALHQDRIVIASHLQKYLDWYNETRPHQSLGYLSPSQYIQSLQSNM